MNDFIKYFNKKKPSGAIFLIIFGTLFSLITMSIDGGFLPFIIGIGMIAFGIYLTSKFYAKQSDVTIDTFCRTQANEYYRKNKQALKFQNKKITDSLLFDGFCFDNIFNARLARQGKDGILRSSIYEMSCMFFVDDCIYFYSQKISLITNEISQKQCNFKIQDIQMVSIEENTPSFGVAVSIPGNEKIKINCKNKENALEVYDKIKDIAKIQ